MPTPLSYVYEVKQKKTSAVVLNTILFIISKTQIRLVEEKAKSEVSHH